VFSSSLACGARQDGPYPSRWPSGYASGLR
jgi:hypothetical protein